VTAALLGDALGCSGASPSPPWQPLPSKVVGTRSDPAPRNEGGPVESRPGRTLLGEPAAVALPHSIEPVDGGRSVLFVSHFADERVGFVRRQDAAGRGPPIRLVGEHVVAAFDTEPGGFALVTSDGQRLCVASYKNDGDTPSARGCAAMAPEAVVHVSDRLWLLDAVVDRPPGPPPDATPPPRPKKRKKTKGGKKSKAAASAPRRPAPKLPVDVRARAVSFTGAFSSEVVATGLRFTRPLEGMTLIDAGGRPGGIDLLWYAWNRPQPAKAKGLGRASIMAGSLRPDATHDPATAVTVVEGELAYGFLDGHHWARLLTNDSGSAFLGVAGRGGPCEAARTAPALMRLAPGKAQCLVDPFGILSARPLTAADAAALDTILKLEPRRVPMQPAHDPGLLAWGNDRGFFVSAGVLRSTGRDGAVRDEPAAFASKRSRLAWGGLAPDGDAIALVSGRLVRALPDGRVEALDAALPKVVPPLRQAELSHVDRRRVARIGSSWFMARGDVVRLWPEPRSIDELRGRAHVDGTSLVGGADVGLFVEIVSGRMRVTRLDGSGRLGVPVEAPAPVRAGFDAVPRARGGALLAGMPRGAGQSVVAVALGPDGTAIAPPTETSLRLASGELGVRLVALPEGGALLSDLARRTVVWIDDDAKEVAAAAWPIETGGAECLDGIPARALVPRPEPGKLSRVAELAVPGSCMLGDPIWAADGALRWLGTSVGGLDSVAEIGVARPAPDAALQAPKLPPARPNGSAAAPSTIAAPAGAMAAPPTPCPADMVLAKAFCIDRFESTLVDSVSGEVLSPDWPVAPNLLDLAVNEWTTGRTRVGNVHARAWPLPQLPSWQRSARPQPIAVSRFGVRPNGYVHGNAAAAACTAAGKRLCSADEFSVACRGEADTLFPYGENYEDGRCNVFRDDHPAAILHNNSSIGHLDPRLNRVTAKGEPLLRTTGATPTCRSRWGDDAVYDLVGNVDEWVDEPTGAFAGGFFSRSTRAGCEALITAHPRHYADYSTGVRCCRDAAGIPRPTPKPASPSSDPY
jgi:hypothetical protein